MKTIDPPLKTGKILTKEIENILTTIREPYPELVKFIGEMPVKISYKANDKIHNQNLEDYNESLKTLLSKYSRTHVKNTKN